jgi:hypothetical protein
MRLLVSVLLLLVFISGCSPSAAIASTPVPDEHNPYPDLGQAPELTNKVWINSDAPLRFSDLHGKVVLLDMWTFG